MHQWPNRYWSSKKKPILMSTYNEIQEDKVYSSNPLDMFKSSFWCSYIAIQNVIKTELQSVNRPKKSYDTNCLRNDIIPELNGTYMGWHKLFTDGSKSTDMGAAYYDPINKNSGSYKIVSKVSIMTAELLAISEALSYAATLCRTNIVILTDSKSALQHVARCAYGHRGVPIAYVVLGKIYQFMNDNINVVLQWIPSHIGLRGNEEADRLAKVAGTSGVEIYIRPMYSEIISKFKNYCHEEWKNHFDERSKSKGIWYKIIQKEPPRVPWFSSGALTRNDIVTAHRVRSGHMPLRGFAFLMKKVSSPNCEFCGGKTEDVQHVLMECGRNEPERCRLLRKLKLNKLNVGIFTNILAQPSSQEAKMIYTLVNNNNSGT